MKLFTAKSEEPVTEISGEPVKFNAAQPSFLIVNAFVIDIGLQTSVLPKSVLLATCTFAEPFMISMSLDTMLMPLLRFNAPK